jgi:FkbM family methyltransferase
MMSYAQNHEDVLLNRLFPPDYKGFYVDVGASHPVHGSITKHFYDRSWHGVNIEPGSVFETLRSERPRDINLKVALSQTAGRATLHHYPDAFCEATLSEVVAKENARRSFACVPIVVELMTLAQVCEQHVGDQTIDFMSIDVEGHEQQVIAGGDWSRFRPRALVIEATVPHSPTPSHDDWEPLLLEHDYHFALFDGLNRFYVRGEDADLLPRLSTPACIFDAYVPYATLLHVASTRSGRHWLGQFLMDQGGCLPLAVQVAKRVALGLARRAKRIGRLGPAVRKLARGKVGQGKYGTDTRTAA